MEFPEPLPSGYLTSILAAVVWLLPGGVALPLIRLSHRRMVERGTEVVVEMIPYSGVLSRLVPNIPNLYIGSGPVLTLHLVSESVIMFPSPPLIRLVSLSMSTKRLPPGPWV